MQIKKIALLTTSIFIAFLIAGCSTTKTTETGKQALTPTKMLKKMRANLDPNNKLHGITSETTIGTMTIETKEGAFKAKITGIYKEPDKFMTITEMFGIGKVTRSISGDKAWEKSSLKGTRKITGKELDSFRLQVAMESIKSDWTKIFRTMSIGEKLVKVGKYQCYKLTCIPKGKYNISSPVIYYLDNKLFFPRRIDVTIFTQKEKIPETVLIDNYKVFDGIMEPTKVITHAMNAKMVFTVDSIKWNTKINDKKFQTP